LVFDRSDGALGGPVPFGDGGVGGLFAVAAFGDFGGVFHEVEELKLLGGEVCKFVHFQVIGFQSCFEFVVVGFHQG
jgi:hypothetical protein